MAATKTPRPCDWCSPRGAFGDPAAPVRRWLPPEGEAELFLFRAAVVQHAVAVTVRRFKNAHKPDPITQDDLGRMDFRQDAANHWNRRLNGREAMSLRDVAWLMSKLPGAMPSESDIQVWLNVAEKKEPRPSNWPEVDE